MKELAVVTGGSRGIGLAITKKLIEMNFAVAVIHENEKQARIKIPKDQGFEFIGDVGIIGDVLAFHEQLKIKAKENDWNATVLVNNAGKASAKKFMDLTENDFEEMLKTNLMGAFFMSREFVKICEKGNNESVSSRIINISSVSGLQGFSGHAHYCASKFALNGMMQVMAKELSKLGIAVNNICPGPTATGMWERLDEEYKEAGFMPKEAREDDYFSKLLIKRIGEPEDIAQAVEFLVKSEYTTGVNLIVSGGNILR